MSNLAFLHQQHAGSDTPEHNPFWCAAIGSGAGSLADLASHTDQLSKCILGLPVRTAVTRPMVGQYLCMIRTLACAWQARTRPAIGRALEALAFVGDSMQQPHMRAAFAQRGSGALAGARAADALRRRMAAPLAAFDQLSNDIASYLAQMARASHDLECDTALVTERLQADAMHAFLLSQQGTALQSRLDDVQLRRDAGWLLGPHAEQLQQESALHASALEGVRRQLAQLQAEQSATRAEADYLQSLLPSLSGFLAAVDSCGSAIDAVRDGSATLSHTLLVLARALAASGPHAAAAQLQAALPAWRAVADAASALRR